MQKVKLASLPMPEKRETTEKVTEKPSNLLPSSAVIISTLTAAAYLTGVSFHQSYLETFKVPYGLFTKSSAENFLYAHRAVSELVPAWIDFAGKNIGVVGTVFLMFALVIGFKSLGEYVDKSARMKRIREKANGSKAFGLFGKLLVYPFLFSMAMLFYVPLILFMLMVIPVAIGNSGGVKAANADIASFEGGCIHPKGKNAYCHDVLLSDKLLARGFIIDMSDKYVAILVDGVPKTIPIKDQDFLPFVNPTAILGK